MAPGDGAGRLYEWVHVFEGLIRTGERGSVDLRSVLAAAGNTRWS
ncbi:MAG: hypothetical protein U0736_13795 [Gemmataceae bacterium]